MLLSMRGPPLIVSDLTLIRGERKKMQKKEILFVGNGCLRAKNFARRVVQRSEVGSCGVSEIRGGSDALRYARILNQEAREVELSRCQSAEYIYSLHGGNDHVLPGRRKSIMSSLIIESRSRST